MTEQREVQVDTLVRLRDGQIWKNSNGNWIKIEFVHRNAVSYNVSKSIQWAGGRLNVSKYKFKKMLIDGNYKAT